MIVIKESTSDDDRCKQALTSVGEISNQEKIKPKKDIKHSTNTPRVIWTLKSSEILLLSSDDKPISVHDKKAVE